MPVPCPPRILVIDDSPEDIRAQLLALRARSWRVTLATDGQQGYQRAREADDRKKGVLVGVYRQVGKHVKLGVGYNFTGFSDNLTDLSYDSRGVFVNVLSTF